MDLRTRLCFAISRRLIKPPQDRGSDPAVYARWRYTMLTQSWSGFSDALITGKDVLDFGCGDGQLALFLLSRKPRSMLGVDIIPGAIERANARASGTPARFLLGSEEGIPLPDRSVDTILAFDMLEHVMQPGNIIADWFRVLRPGGRVAIEWYPFKGPYGPHMEGLIPIPWAHVLFGERAMFRTAAMIYELPEFAPRYWDLQNGQKKPNKFAQCSTFAEQGFLNQLDIPTFERLARGAGFNIARFEKRGFGGPFWRRAIGATLRRLPFVGEYFVISALIELERPVA